MLNKIQEIHYNEIRNEIQHFRTYRSQLQQNGSKETTQLMSKWQKPYGTLISFDFEAAILLKHWDSLPSLIEESSTIIDRKLSALFLDSILSSEAPVSIMTRVVMVRLQYKMQQTKGRRNLIKVPLADIDQRPTHVLLHIPKQNLLSILTPSLSPLPLPSFPRGERDPASRSRLRQGTLPRL